MTSPYATPAAFRRALTDRLRALAHPHGPWPLAELQRQFAYDRLLAQLRRSRNSRPADGVLACTMTEAAGPPERPVADHRAAAERIRHARAEAAGLAESLMRQWEGVVDAAASTGNDDEHDPEGPTIAYEREQLQAMRERVRGELADLDRAAQRLREGVYWTCEGCGGPIAAARLSARPTARTCIGCASLDTAQIRNRK